MSTRSGKLWSGQQGAGNITVFTVPAGMTYIVKNVIAANENGVADTVSAYARDGGNTHAFVMYAVPLAAGARAEWQGWLVLAPGDYFRVGAVTNLCDFWISGTALNGTI